MLERRLINKAFAALGAACLLLAGCTSATEEQPAPAGSTLRSTMVDAPMSAAPSSPAAETATSAATAAAAAGASPADTSPAATADQPVSTVSGPGDPTAADGDSGELGGPAPTFTMPALVGMPVNQVQADTRLGTVRYTNIGGEAVSSTNGRLVCQQQPDAGTQASEGAVVLAISNTC